MHRLLPASFLALITVIQFALLRKSGRPLHRQQVPRAGMYLFFKPRCKPVLNFNVAAILLYSCFIMSLIDIHRDCLQSNVASQVIEMCAYLTQ